MIGLYSPLCLCSCCCWPFSWLCHYSDLQRDAQKGIIDIQTPLVQWSAEFRVLARNDDIVSLIVIADIWKTPQIIMLQWDLPISRKYVQDLPLTTFSTQAYDYTWGKANDWKLPCWTKDDITYNTVWAIVMLLRIQTAGINAHGTLSIS